MGAASTEVETHALGRVVHLAVTSARLELGTGKQGSVLVVEDTRLRSCRGAQRQLAWKRKWRSEWRHEIK